MVQRSYSATRRAALAGASLLAFGLSTGALVPRTQTSADPYTRYELLAPGSESFRIVYDVSATTPGAGRYFNSVRAGSEVRDVAVRDRASGHALEFEIVDGERARSLGHSGARPDGRYIAVELARPVPPRGAARIRIEKTYRDSASYRVEGDELVFERTLSIPRNAVVLPAGFEIVGCNFPSQVAREADGRIRVSFMNAGPAPAPLEIRARALPPPSEKAPAGEQDPAGQIGRAPDRGPPAGPPRDYEYRERAFEDREIVYFLLAPETHSFRLYHDYTEKRPGVDRYLNVVRAGSKATDPVARVLDTGEELEVVTLRGEAIAAAGIELSSPITPETEVVVIRFDPVPAGASVRLRIEETYTDPERYGLRGEELVWARSFGRNRNAIVLPDGWFLTASSIPAVVTTTPDGRLRLDYVNPRPDSIYAVVKARRR